MTHKTVTHEIIDRACKADDPGYIAPVYDSAYGMNPWALTIEAMYSGEVIEISEDVFSYFLGVLPPVYMGRVMVIGGERRRVAFGFAEGYEPITAFWTEGTRTVQDGPEGGSLRCYCQRTAEMNTAG